MKVHHLLSPFLVLFLLALLDCVLAQSCSKEKKCETPSCCSEWGNCGYGPDFCGKGCQNGCDEKPECGKYADEGKKACPLKVCCSEFGFCGTTKDFCEKKGDGKGCQGNCDVPKTPKCSSGRKLFNIGYYASWAAFRKCEPFAVSNIDPRNFTHLNYAFGNISQGVMVAPGGDEEKQLKEFVALREVNPDLKVLISVGGWAFNDPGPTRKEFHNIVASKGARSKFIDSVVKYLSDYSLDGIDIDYEYPVAEDRGGSPEDSENYLQLVKEMKPALKGKLLTIAAPASYWYLRHFKIGAMSEYLDWINVMSYDIHGTWDQNITSLGPYVKSHTNITEIKEAIELFLRDGVKPEKLVLGLGLYGRAFTLKDRNCRAVGCEFSGPSKKGRCTNAAGVLAWFEIAEIEDEKKVLPKYDKPSMSQILSWDDQWVAFDDDRTLSEKRNYASTACFAGVMFWSIDQGLDRSEGEFTLQRLGSVPYAMIHFSFEDDYIHLETTADARNGFVSASIIGMGVEPKSSRRIKRQPGPSKPGANTCSIVRNFFNVASFFAALITRLQNHAATGIGNIRIIRPNNANNPVVESYLRQLPNGAERVEMMVAHYRPAHYVPNHRINFPDSGNTSTAYMRNNLNALTTDERGHLAANFANGPAEAYNMVPQHRSVNRNYHSTWILNDWYNVEAQIRSWLADNRGTVRWHVAVTYADGNTGRPSSFTYEAIFEDGNGNQVDSIFGVIRNCPPSSTSSGGKCVGL